MPSSNFFAKQQSGFSLVELLVVIVVLGIAASTLTMVASRSAELSASNLREQQALTLANAVLDEVRAMPFTFCDPNATNAGTATSTAACIGGPAENLTQAADGSEMRGGVGAAALDNVNDYNNQNIAAGALRDVFNNLLNGTLPLVSNCSVNIRVFPQAMTAVPASEGNRIVVSVSCPGQFAPVVAETIRLRYAPNQFQY